MRTKKIWGKINLMFIFQFCQCPINHRGGRIITFPAVCHQGAIKIIDFYVAVVLSISVQSLVMNKKKHAEGTIHPIVVKKCLK